MTHDDEVLINIITKVVMLPQVQKDICSQDEIDQQKYKAFDDERVNTTEVNLWARVKKVELKTWKSARKPVKHKLADKIAEIKYDRSLFSHIMSVACSRPELNLIEASWQHKLIFVPQALFAIEGKLLSCTDKSNFRSILDELPNQDKSTDSQQSEISTVAGISIRNSKEKEYDAIHLVFDRYNLTSSLKEATRDRRQDGFQLLITTRRTARMLGKLTHNRLCQAQAPKMPC